MGRNLCASLIAGQGRAKWPNDFEISAYECQLGRGFANLISGMNSCLQNIILSDASSLENWLKFYNRNSWRTWTNIFRDYSIKCELNPSPGARTLTQISRIYNP